MVTPSEFRKGLKVVMDGQPYVIVEYQFVKPGKGVAFTRTRFKNLITGNVIDVNVRSGEKLALANTEEVEMSFLYKDGDQYTFMNNETYEQIQLDKDDLGDAIKYLTENMVVQVLLYNGKPIGIDVPNFVTLEVTHCEPGIKGDTATGATKPATLSTGATVLVPLFVEQGDWIKVDTRTHTYLERIKK